MAAILDYLGPSLVHKLNVKNPIKNPLYLTITYFLSNVRKKITQDYLGEQSDEILANLKKTFKLTEIDELITGAKLEIGNKQYELTGKYPASKLGNIIVLPKQQPAAEIKMPDITSKEVELTWNQKIRKYREQSGKSSATISKEMNAPYDIVASAQRSQRKFTKEELIKFFEIIGKPVDPSIPFLDARMHSARKRAPKNIEEKESPVVKAVKEEKESPVVKAVKEVQPVVIPESLVELATQIEIHEKQIAVLKQKMLSILQA